MANQNDNTATARLPLGLHFNRRREEIRELMPAEVLDQISRLESDLYSLVKQFTEDTGLKTEGVSFSVKGIAFEGKYLFSEYGVFEENIKKYVKSRKGKAVKEK